MEEEEDSLQAIFKQPVGSENETPLYREGILMETFIAGIVK
jgi:hypothetical protein